MQLLPNDRTRGIGPLHKALTDALSANQLTVLKPTNAEYAAISTLHYSYSHADWDKYRCLN